MSDERKLEQSLSISFRPQTFDQLVGQKRIAKLIRAHYQSGRSVPAWMLIGDAGYGKTTIARILALSLQCRHQTEFGNPCADCQARRAEFDIIEVNASDISGVNEIQQVIAGSNYMPRSPSKRRVYILDEAQKLTDSAQNMLLKPFEDSPKSTVWIICTTNPGKILKTLRSRCLTYTLEGLGLKGVELLVQKAIAQTGVKKETGPLVDALHEQNVTSPRLVVMAVEKYLAGDEPERAAQVGMDAAVNTLRICRAVLQGDWASIRKELATATPDDARAIRGAVSGYMKTVMLGDPSSNTRKCAEAIQLMGHLPYDEGVQLPWTCAVLYIVCKSFKR